MFACALLGLLGVGLYAQRCAPRHPSLATFNIRDFPEREEQVSAAFEVMRSLDVPIIALQEIRNVAVFRAAAGEQLGPHWQSVFNHEPQADDGEPPRLVGLTWDERRYQLDFHVTHEDVRVKAGQRPALEVRLIPRGRGPALRVFVVHLKAGGNEGDQRLRRKQLERLWQVVGDARRSYDEVIVLGDFNATSEADRRALAIFADETMLHWASESLACTAYWRPGGRCQGSALDHVFTSIEPRAIAAKGACERVGCEPDDVCPIEHEQISDHCPVAVEL